MNGLFLLAQRVIRAKQRKLYIYSLNAATLSQPFHALALLKPRNSSWLKFEEIQEEFPRKRRKYLDFGED